MEDELEQPKEDFTKMSWGTILLKLLGAILSAIIPITLWLLFFGWEYIPSVLSFFHRITHIFK